MRKADIQHAVREHLAMIGYGSGDYGWKRGRLSILVDANARLNGGARAGENPMGGAFIELHLPAGSRGVSRERLLAELASLPTKGLARPVARAPSASKAMQMELV